MAGASTAAMAISIALNSALTTPERSIFPMSNSCESVLVDSGTPVVIEAV
jgi:hypothetical protein